MTIHNSIAELVGNTPLLRLNRFIAQFALPAEILAKLEYFNPNHSVKDRIALAMIEEAERSGKLKPGDTIADTTSGNTGIGLAAIAAAKGYPFRVYLHDRLSEERFQILRALGAEVIPYSQVEGFREILENCDGDFVAAARWLAQNVITRQPNVFHTAQLENPANPGAHRLTTGPEIWQQTAGQLDIVIVAVGTGGTISGVGQYLKQQNPAIKIIAVEPGPHSVPAAGREDIRELTGVHAFSGVLPERIPPNLNLSIIDEAIAVESWQATEAARAVAQSDGILIGESAGGVLWAAREVAQRPENHGKRIVTLLADSGLSYLSTDLFNHNLTIGQLQVNALLHNPAIQNAS